MHCYSWAGNLSVIWAWHCWDGFTLLRKLKDKENENFLVGRTLLYFLLVIFWETTTPAPLELQISQLDKGVDLHWRKSIEESHVLNFVPFVVLMMWCSRLSDILQTKKEAWLLLETLILEVLTLIFNDVKSAEYKKKSNTKYTHKVEQKHQWQENIL